MSLNPIDHTAEANRLIAIATAESTDPRDTLIVARAQVHATLAMAESLRAIVKTDETIDEANDARLSELRSKLYAPSPADLAGSTRRAQ